jgi:hypothetical protein
LDSFEINAQLDFTWVHTMFVNLSGWNFAAMFSWGAQLMQFSFVHWSNSLLLHYIWPIFLGQLVTLFKLKVVQQNWTDVSRFAQRKTEQTF